MKRPGISMPASGMAPGTSASDAEQASWCQGRLSLIFEKEFLVSERTTDIRLETQSLLQHVLHLRLKVT